MRFKPHQYQLYMIYHALRHPYAGLFVDMGLGKTVCALSTLVELRYNQFHTFRTLVVGPKRVVTETWPEEIEKWDHTKHLQYRMLTGTPAKRMAEMSMPADLYLTTRDILPSLVEGFGKRWPFQFVIVDELSGFKSASAARTKALRKIRPYCSRVLGLTGTPAPNGMKDLWSQLNILDMGARLGRTEGEYKRTYFYPREQYTSNGMVRTEWVLKENADKVIQHRISDICVSLRTEDWLSLPEKIDLVHKVKLTPAAKQRYRTLEKDLLLPMKGVDIIAATASGLTNKLLQLANGAVYDEDRGVHIFHDAKLDMLDEIIEASPGQNLLVFYAFRHDAARIQKRFPHARQLKNAEDTKAWSAGEVPLLIAHPASAGHGLNLQHGGNHVVWFGLNWSLELYQQGIKRIHRQGQKRTVFNHLLIAEDTVDEDVLSVLADKSGTQDKLLNALRARVARID